MKHWKILLPTALLLSSLWFACRDQDYDDDFQPSVDVAFAGRVIDEDGQPIEGAQVRAGNELAVTDANGVFRTQPVSLPARDAKLFINKIGYFDFSRAFIVQDDALQTVTVQLLRKELVGTFNGGSGGIVNVPGGVTLNFPTGSVNAVGQIYVFAKYLDPTSAGLAYQMPGDLRGISAGGDEQILSTFGMLGVEIEDQSGQALQIATGSEVELSIPIPSGQASAVPASIPLWYFDPDKARWIEEGSAQKVGSQYVGKVKHFTWWNCDFPYPAIVLSGTVYLGDLQHPLADAHVWVSPVGNGLGWGAGHGTTDANGHFSGGVPKDLPLELSIVLYNQCNGLPVYIQTIGSFSQDATLSPIILTNVNTQNVTVSGRLLDCANQPVANGYAKIEVDNTTYFGFSDVDGAFELNFVSCNSNLTTGSAIGYDLTHLLESATQNFNINSGTADLGDITVCNALSEYIQYTLDGQSYTMIFPSGSIGIDTIGSGTTSQVALSAFDSLQLNGIYLAFNNNNNNTGTFSMVAFFVNGLETFPAQAANVSTNLTDTGNVGELLIGTFSGNFTATNGTNHTISGSYRVVRDW